MELISYFKYTHENNGLYIYLNKVDKPKFLFGKEKNVIIPFDSWSIIRPNNAELFFSKLASDLSDIVLKDDIKAIEGGIWLSYRYVSDLSENALKALELPEIVKLIYEIKTEGVLPKDNFRIKGQWLTLNGNIARIEQTGCVIKYNGKDYIIPAPIYKIINLIESVEYKASVANKYEVIANLKEVIGDEYFNNIDVDPFINKIKIRYGSAFSLDIKDDNGSVYFEPVLFSKGVINKLGNDEDENLLDESDDSLLPKNQQEQFLKSFRNSDGNNSSYLLNDGTIVYIDSRLKDSLSIVRKAQRLKSSYRREFAANPRKYLYEAMGDNADEELLENIFIETKQYSERVLGIDIWRKPVLPWIKAEPNGWLPEKFGIRIGEEPNDKMLEITPEEVEPVLGKCNSAFHEGAASFVYNGIEIPASLQTKQSLEDLNNIAHIIENKHFLCDNDEGVKERFAGKYFLKVKDNLEDIEYNTLFESNFSDADVPQFPDYIINKPKEHQISGFKWLAKNYLSKTPGALLADDMGLGKTYQIISFLAWLKKNKNVNLPILIVAPSGLIANWRQEFSIHLGMNGIGKVVSLTGKQLTELKTSKLKDINVGESGLDTNKLTDTWVVLTTYETMRDYHISIAQTHFAAIIYDEAQKLKNPSSQITRAAKSLKADIQIAMTGTPVENSLHDLWSIFDVVYPGLLGAGKTFEQRYNNGEASSLKELNSILTTNRRDKPPAMIRRMKDECLDSMPRKHVINLPYKMPEIQANQYLKAVTKAKFAKDTNSNRGYMLEVIQELRGISLHPLSPSDYNNNSDYFSLSARLISMFNVVDKICEKREKVLIFCESLDMQTVLAGEIKRRYKLSHDIDKINGSVPSSIRQIYVNHFQNRGDCFDALILSPKAGGVGLTITAANHVIHLSRWWNPAVEDQSTDRAYRIGQTKDVYVYIPQAIHPDANIAPNSFDLKLAALMERKRKLSRDFLLPEKDGKDAEILINDVIGEGNDDTKVIDTYESNLPNNTIDIIKPKNVLSVKLSDKTKQSLSKLIIPKKKENIDSSVLPVPLGNRIQFLVGQSRKLEFFTDRIKNKYINELIIEDPYMLANVNDRKNLISFVNLFKSNSKSLNSVKLVFYDVDSLRENTRETDELREKHIAHMWSENFGKIPKLRLSCCTRRNGFDLHDRKVEASTMSGEKLVWDLSRGIIGIFNIKYACVINFNVEK